MRIDETENDTSSPISSSVSEFKDNNVENIVISKLVADLCSAKNKATTIVTKLPVFFFNRPNAINQSQHFKF